MTRRRKRSWVLKLLVPLILAVALLLWRFPAEVGHDDAPKNDSSRFQIMRCLDGDTAELTDGERVRLLGIDTPEHGEPFADEARDLLIAVTHSRSTRLEFDHHRRDKYGRLLGFIYAPDPASPEHELHVNRMLVDSGLAYVYLTDDQELRKPEYRELLEAQRRAIDAKIGLWGMTRSSESYYYAIKGSYRLHRPGCARVAEHSPEKLIRYSDRLDGLRQGLSPCRECKP